jgi:hypothetical protein
VRVFELALSVGGDRDVVLERRGDSRERYRDAQEIRLVAVVLRGALGEVVIGLGGQAGLERVGVALPAVLGRSPVRTAA